MQVAGSAASSAAPEIVEASSAEPKLAASAPHRRLAAEACATYPDGRGRIAYHMSKEAFEATCGYHKNCVLTRTAKGKWTKGCVHAGRPLGMLSVWLSLGASCGTKEEHWQRDKWKSAMTKLARSEARSELSSLAGGAELISHERALEDGESIEPETLQGMGV
eukprot:6473600-Amphidinium_carterae.1